MSPKKERCRLKIVKGPSKYDFLDAIGRRKHPESEVDFTVALPDGEEVEISVRIVLVMKWNQDGKLPGQEGHLWYFIAHKNFERDCRVIGTTFRGMYSTQKRDGWIEEISDKEYLFLRKMLRGTKKGF